MSSTTGHIRVTQLTASLTQIKLEQHNSIKKKSTFIFTGRSLLGQKDLPLLAVTR